MTQNYPVVSQNFDTSHDTDLRSMAFDAIMNERHRLGVSLCLYRTVHATINEQRRLLNFLLCSKDNEWTM